MVSFSGSSSNDNILQLMEWIGKSVEKGDDFEAKKLCRKGFKTFPYLKNFITENFFSWNVFQALGVLTFYERNIKKIYNSNYSYSIGTFNNIADTVCLVGTHWAEKNIEEIQNGNDSCSSEVARVAICKILETGLRLLDYLLVRRDLIINFSGSRYDGNIFQLLMGRIGESVEKGDDVKANKLCRKVFKQSPSLEMFILKERGFDYSFYFLNFFQALGILTFYERNIEKLQDSNRFYSIEEFNNISKMACIIGTRWAGYDRGIEEIQNSIDPNSSETGCRVGVRKILETDLRLLDSLLIKGSDPNVLWEIVKKIVTYDYKVKEYFSWELLIELLKISENLEETPAREIWVIIGSILDRFYIQAENIQHPCHDIHGLYKKDVKKAQISKKHCIEFIETIMTLKLSDKAKQEKYEKKRYEILKEFISEKLEEEQGLEYRTRPCKAGISLLKKILEYDSVYGEVAYEVALKGLNILIQNSQGYKEEGLVLPNYPFEVLIAIAENKCMRKEIRENIPQWREQFQNPQAVEFLEKLQRRWSFQIPKDPPIIELLERLEQGTKEREKIKNSRSKI